jgi:transposase
MDTMKRPVIQVEGDALRRRHSLDFKQRVVEETLKSGASVARIARANGVNANQVFLWRKLHREGGLGTSAGTTCLVPVTVVPDEPTARVWARSDRGDAGPFGRMHLESTKGSLTIEGRPDAIILRLVLENLLR